MSKTLHHCFTAKKRPSENGQVSLKEGNDIKEAFVEKHDYAFYLVAMCFHFLYQNIFITENTIFTKNHLDLKEMNFARMLRP